MEEYHVVIRLKSGEPNKPPATGDSRKDNERPDGIESLTFDKLWKGAHIHARPKT